MPRLPWPAVVGPLALVAAIAGCEVGDRPLPYDTGPRQRIELGRQLLAQYQCGTCHAIPAVDAAQGTTGPSLVAFGKRSYIAGQHPNLPDNLVRWIVDPPALVPGTKMPSMGVSPDDAHAMAAYLLSLK